MYFMGTFETGNTNQFTSASGSVQSSVVKEDTYAGLNENNENFLKNINTDYGLSDIAKTYAGAWFRWTGTIDNGWYVMLGDGAGSTQWALYTLTGSKLKIVINGVTYNGTTVLSANAWYFIMVEFYCHDSAGYAKVYVNGTLDINTGTIDSKTGTDTGVRQIKWQGTNSGGGVNTYVDDCLFSDTDPNFGIKVSKAGKDISSLDSKNLSFISNATFLKFHGEYTTSATFNPGDQSVTAEITHGLGYVPAFVAYGVRSDDGATFIIPSIPYAISEFDYAEAWADTNKIYFKVTLFDDYAGVGWNEIRVVADQTYYDFWIPDDGPGIVVGNGGAGGKSTAWRFPNVPINKDQSIVSANIDINHVFSGSASTDTPYRVYGIDEDDVGDVDTGKSRTDAYDARNQAKVSGFWNFGTDCKDQVAEIIARSGWSNGNNIGILLIDDGADSNEYIGADSSTNGVLTILKTGTMTVNFRVIVFKDKIAT